MANVVKYIFVLGKKKNAMSLTKVFWKWYHQNRFLIDKLFVMFGCALKHAVGIHMGTNTDAPLSDLLFQSYAADWSV